LYTLRTERGDRILVVADGAQQTAERATGQPRGQDRNNEQHHCAQPEQEIAILVVADTQGVAHRIDQPGNAVETVEQRGIRLDDHVQHAHRTQSRESEIDRPKTPQGDHPDHSRHQNRDDDSDEDRHHVGQVISQNVFHWRQRRTHCQDDRQIGAERDIAVVTKIEIT